MRLTVGLRFRKVVRLELPRAFQKADSEKNGAVVGNIFDVRRQKGPSAPSFSLKTAHFVTFDEVVGKTIDAQARRASNMLLTTGCFGRDTAPLPRGRSVRPLS